MNNGYETIKYTEQQQTRLDGIAAREAVLQETITTAIVNREMKLPLGFMLESRFNSLIKAGIEYEARIEKAKAADDQFSEGLVPKLELRLEHIKGAITEVQNIADMIAEYNMYGREFDTSTIKQKRK
jgi:hypothetical protein